MPAREWPNNAAWARDTAAEEIIQALRELEPLMQEDKPMTYDAIVRRIGRAFISANKALRALEAVGARTRAIPQ